MKNDWIELGLGEVLKTTSGGTPSRGNPNYYLGSIPWVKSGELNQNTILETEEHISEEAVKNSSAKIFPKGTLLIALYGATIGKLAFLGISAATNQAVCGIFESEALESKFLYYFLLHNRRKLVEQGAGGAQPNISQTILKNLPIVVAPLPEQRAIVSKIEELFSELDHSIASFKAAKAKLEIYRQAVLKKAFEGGYFLENLESWKFLKTKNVCQNIKVGIVIQPKKFYSIEENGIKAFRSANVREFRVNDTNWVYFSKSGNKINHRTQLNEGDVLIVRSGYPGTSCVVPKKFEGCNAIDILIATPNKDIILPEYLCAFNNSPLGKGLFYDGARGVAQKHLNVGVYSNLELPIPSIKEQEYILQEIETRLSVADKLAETIEINLKKSEALRQSILKKAFEGKLLSEAELEACRKEADWEPAEKLLERIKSDKKTKS